MELDIQSTLLTATWDAHSGQINFSFYNLNPEEKKFRAKLRFVYFIAPFGEWCNARCPQDLNLDLFTVSAPCVPQAKGPF